MGAADRIPPEPEVVWSPTPKQETFLSAGEFEVLFGGAAGGGKTDGLLVDALGLQQGGWESPDYQGIIFRRTYPDLKDIIERSHAVYKDFEPGASYDKQAHVWRFPSGARIEFGFIQYDAQRFRYRGRAFAYIGWEEITLWPTPAPYKYLMSRLRVPATSKLVTYVRATTNPDGPGYQWVKDHWQIATTGEATCFPVTVTDEVTGAEYKRMRRFIPARVEDNPHIGEDYLITLSMLDEDERNALRKGLWMPPKIRGAYYAEQILKARQDGRVTKVPYQPGVPVNTFWDLGVNDTTAIWCHQLVALQNRWLRCMEDSGQDLSYYAKWLQETGFVFGTHYLPHDAEHRRLSKNSTKSWREMLEELLPGQTFEIIERVDDVNIGINQTRSKMVSCWWDDDGCAEGLAALENYRKIWDEEAQVFRNKPLHDWASNYADAFRQFGQCEDTFGDRKGFNRAKHRTNHVTA